MSTADKWPFEHVSFSRQFMLAVAAVFLVATAGIGAWLGQQIESSAVNRAAQVSAAYVESIVTTFLREWPAAEALSESTHDALDRVFLEGPLHDSVVRFKLWDPSGRILYSEDHEQIGRQYAVEASLAAAFDGRVQSHITYPARPDNLREQRSGSRLLEVYVPVRSMPDGRVKAVAEFYHSMDAIDGEIVGAKWRSWLLVAAGGTALYLLLYSRVRRASRTIAGQQRDLKEQLRRLRESLAENERMRASLSRAGARTTALNERFLQRIAADIHDGPAQDLSFALLRFDDMARSCDGCERAGSAVDHDLKAIPAALASSLGELRSIASGLGAPGIAELDVAEAVRRALREGERKRGSAIEARTEGLPAQAPLAARITLYRLLQESIANSSRHAPGAPLRVRVAGSPGCLEVEVSDEGPGFEPARGLEAGRLGLALMRERVRLLGGTFEIDSAPGRGTRILASIPTGNSEVASA
jgi:hypothetical protein